MDDPVFPFVSFPPGLGLFSGGGAEGFPRAFPEGFFGRFGVSSRDSLVSDLSLVFTAKTIRLSKRFR